MPVIIYKFVDGTTNAVEVADEIYLIHLELLQQEKNNYRRETRRHTSLYYFTDMGIEFEDKRVDILAEIIRKENIERVRKEIMTLTDRRRDLVHKAFYDEMKYRAIAEQAGVSPSAISERMSRLRNQLQKKLSDWSF